MKKIIIDGDEFTMRDLVKAFVAIVGFIALCAVLNSIR